MWISEQTAAKRISASGTKIGRVTIGGEQAAVLAEGESRKIRSVAPAGFLWKPRTGTEVLVLETEEGERFILGEVVPAAGFQNGEILLKCGETMLKIGSGAVEITGRLLLNGAEVQVGGEQ